MHSGPVEEKMSHAPDYIQIRVKERKDTSPGEHVRAVGMCFYGSGQDLVKAKTYKLERNAANFKDKRCIEVKRHGQVRVTLNGSVSLQLAPLMDNNTVWETTW